MLNKIAPWVPYREIPLGRPRHNDVNKFDRRRESRRGGKNLIKMRITGKKALTKNMKMIILMKRTFANVR